MTFRAIVILMLLLVAALGAHASCGGRQVLTAGTAATATMVSGVGMLRSGYAAIDLSVNEGRNVYSSGRWNMEALEREGAIGRYTIVYTDHDREVARARRSYLAHRAKATALEKVWGPNHEITRNAQKEVQSELARYESYLRRGSAWERGFQRHFRTHAQALKFMEEVSAKGESVRWIYARSVQDARALSRSMRNAGLFFAGVLFFQWITIEEIIQGSIACGRVRELRDLAP